MNRTLAEIFEKQAVVTAADGTQWVDASVMRPDTGRRVLIVSASGFTAVISYYEPERWTLCDEDVLFWTPVCVDSLPGVTPNAWRYQEEKPLDM